MSTSVGWAGWTITAYGFGFVVMLPVSGKLGDRYGRRRVFLVSVAAFTAASLCCGGADHIYVLIGLRAARAAGGGGPLLGVGFGAISPACRNAGLRLAPQHSATLAVLRSMGLQLGSITTVSIATAVLAASPGPGATGAGIDLAVAAALQHTFGMSSTVSVARVGQPSSRTAGGSRTSTAATR